MPWLKTKKVKKCICGKDTKTMITYDDKMQARSWLFLLGFSCLAVVSVAGLWGGFDEDSLKSATIPLLLLAIFWLFFGYFLAIARTKGHTFKCAARQAFLKVI